MLLRDQTNPDQPEGDRATGVELRPLRYEFASARGDRYDDNWLVIGGTVTTPDGNWSFTEPSLMTDEAREIAAWLRAVAAGAVAVVRPDGDGRAEPDVEFTEPLLAFTLVDRGESGATVRVQLSLEAAPPWQQDDGGEGGEDGDGGDSVPPYVVDMRMDAASLRRAAEEWEADLAAFPVR